jgi:hypothetical protein
MVATSHSFLTLSRASSDNSTVSTILTAFPRLFQGLEEKDFRLDLSSTEIRQKRAGIAFPNSDGDNTCIISHSKELTQIK